MREARASSSNSFCDQIEEFDQHAGAALRIGGGPGRLGGFGNRDGVLDFRVLGQRHLGLHLAGIRIEDVAEAARSSLHLFAADEVSNLTHVGFSLET